MSCNWNCAVAPALTETEVDPVVAGPTLMAGLALPAIWMSWGESEASSAREIVSER